jgi:hypothetical protein
VGKFEHGGGLKKGKLVPYQVVQVKLEYTWLGCCDTVPSDLMEREVAMTINHSPERKGPELSKGTLKEI